MTKSDIVYRLAAMHGTLSLRRLETAVDTILQRMTDALAEGQRIELRGFGSFSVRHHGPKRARNPRTGEAVHLEARATPAFRAGRVLRDIVNAATEKTDKQP